MRVVHFDVDGARNCIDVGSSSYIYAKVAGQGFVLGTHCPHRGGPLNLGSLDETGEHLLCPWHGKKNQLTGLMKRSVPAVRAGGRVTAVFNNRADRRIDVAHAPVSDDLR